MKSPDPQLAEYTARLERQTQRLARFLRVRAGAGLVLLGLSAVGATVAGAFLLAGLGVLDNPALTRWTSGFDAVLAVFMPSAFAWLSGRTGLLWWRHRRPDDPQSDCPSC